MEKSKTTAAILSLFGGIFGLHKFYLNDPGSGMFYAILGMVTRGLIGFPVSILLGVLDAVRLFSMSSQQFDAKYNKRKVSRGQNRAKQRPTRARTASRDVRMERQRQKNNNTISRKQRSNPFRKSADQKYKEYDLEGALEDYAKATEITPADKEMHFNMACIYSLLEKPEDSLIHLEQAIDMGYKNLENIKTVDELAFLRIQPEYDDFIANGYKRGARKKSVPPPKDDLLQDDLLLAQLNKLKELRSKGMLSEKEYVYEKEKLMRR